MDVWSSFPLEGWTQGVAEKFSCPCCENRLCARGNTADCLSWSTSARGEFSLSSLECLGFRQDGSFPLHLGSHKNSSFSEMHQNAFQDTCLKFGQNIPPCSKAVSFLWKKLQRFCSNWFHKRGWDFFHPFLHSTFLPSLCEGIAPLPPSAGPSEVPFSPAWETPAHPRKVPTS